MVKWVDFEAEHARKIVAMNSRDQERYINVQFVDLWFENWKGKLRAVTLLSDNEPIACLGISFQEWGKAEAWALLSNSFKDYKLSIYKMAKAGLGMISTEYHRIQATVDPGYPETIRWIEALGFEYEGRLRKYGPDKQDYLMYSRVG